MTDERHDDSDEQRQAEAVGEDTGHPHIKGRSVAEWSTLAISAAILLTIVGLVTWLAFRGDERAPEIVAEPHLDLLRDEASGYYLPVTIRNDGDITVQDAVIQGELDTGEGQPETADITIPFLSGGEEVRGTMVFQQDPTSGELTVSVTSYKEP